MRENDVLTTEFLSLYDYYIYENLIQSLLLRKQGTVHFLAKKNGAVVLWGLSAFIGGEFSKSNGKEVISILEQFSTPQYIYYPNDDWRSFIKGRFSDQLKDKYLNVYQFDNIQIADLHEDQQCIVPVTKEFIANNLPNNDLLIGELYSYKNREDFYQNGFGFALVIDGVIAGYCLSEYSIDNSHGINIWVDEQYRGQGYAKKMVNAFLLRCQEKNQIAYWVCDADNIPSNKVASSSGLILKATMHYFER